MACQIKNKSCYEQIEKGKITSRTSLFGIVKNVFKLNQTKYVDYSPSYSSAVNPEILAIRAKVSATEAHYRRMHMVQ